jgi:hypothetical protein
MWKRDRDYEDDISMCPRKSDLDVEAERYALRPETTKLPACGQCYLHAAILLLVVLIDSEARFAYLHHDVSPKSNPPHDALEGPGQQQAEGGQAEHAEGYCRSK